MTTTDETKIPYRETFGCVYATEDEGCEHPGDCDLDWMCNLCGARLTDGPCLRHVPRDVPGLALVECSAEPRHYLWAADNDAYGTGCPDCALIAVNNAHRGCEHSHHRAWRRWKITHWAASRTYTIGISRGSGYSWGGGCNRCMTGFRWGRSGYALGKPNEWWHCLIRKHHLMRPVPGIEWICDRCCPDPDAGEQP